MLVNQGFGGIIENFILKLKISGNKLQKCPIPCVSCLKLCDKQENL